MEGMSMGVVALNIVFITGSVGCVTSESLAGKLPRSNSVDFPKPAGPRPGTQLAGYKPKGVMQRLFPSSG
jgi:hypothetical protein